MKIAFRFSLLIALWLPVAAMAEPFADPANDPADPSVWPNRFSRANSDRWLVENHDRIRQMNPRLLVLNFSNLRSQSHLDRMTRDLITAIAESSRYHGYRDPAAPVFLRYHVFKFVDLRDAGRTNGNSHLLPIKTHAKPTEFNFEYDALFSPAFGERYRVRDPRQPGRCLRLDELVALGYVHELWFYTEWAPDLRIFECVEEKPVYDERFMRVADKFVQAGNGGDREQKWTGRSLRINHINAGRGIGCAFENLGHALEGTANSKCIAYFTRYFREFAGFNLDERFGAPFSRFYAVKMGKGAIEYPNDHTAVVNFRDKQVRLENYVAFGGNVHFPPNGRHHYDQANTQPVLSTIEDWRIGSGPGGKDLAKPWTNAAFAKYRESAPDCMGPWLIYWRQNMPGLNNRQKDDNRRPMKNWWPFLFY